MQTGEQPVWRPPPPLSRRQRRARWRRDVLPDVGGWTLALMLLAAIVAVSVVSGATVHVIHLHRRAPVSVLHGTPAHDGAPARVRPGPAAFLLPAAARTSSRPAAAVTPARPVPVTSQAARPGPAPATAPAPARSTTPAPVRSSPVPAPTATSPAPATSAPATAPAVTSPAPAPSTAAPTVTQATPAPTATPA